MAQQGQEEEDEEEEVTLSMTSKSVNVDSNGDDGGNRGGGKAARLPRWTRQEILVLIQGKRVAETRVRRGRTAGLQDGEIQVEPKWMTVSSYCKRHGVNRGPVQCRKRWSNLAGDFKKINEWESQITDESESFWMLRNDVRRERKLPGFFDKEVFDILSSNSEIPVVHVESDNPNLKSGEIEAVFDSGRSATGDDGLFSDFENQRERNQDEQDDDDLGRRIENVGDGQIQVHDEHPLVNSSVPDPIPISEKQYQPATAEVRGPGAETNQEKQQVGLNPEIGSTSGEAAGRKRRRTLDEEEGGIHLQAQDELIQVLERNGRVLSAQLDAYNLNHKLDREERKENTSSLVVVLNKLADAMGRIADKL
ncbi:unnamed protein product [Amaranthus hypochondriacus]